jgi:mannose-6-phosphate isomerase
MDTTLNHTEQTPWGKWEVLLNTDYCKVKQIFVNTGHRLSYQKHFKRQEIWTVVQGEATVVLDGETKTLKEGESIFIPLESKHRVENRYNKQLIFIEIQRGSYFGEDDIIRFEDDYNRT